MKKLFFLLMFASLLMASGCEKDHDDSQIVCTQEFVYGLHITVLDAATGLPLTDGVTVKATAGSYHENLFLISGGDNIFVGAGERIGLYTITVTKDSYQIYTSSPIAVTANVCHVNPQSLTVNLQPE